jgi:hypothetical protein
MQVERTDFDALVVNELPDGSKVIVDSRNEKVFALNATAGAAWDACSGPTTLSGVAEEMQRSFNPEITQEVADEAILQLQERKLVTTSEPIARTSRRQLIATLGAIALPLVVSLTMAEQQAHALQARSAVCPPKPKPHPQPPNHWYSR